VFAGTTLLLTATSNRGLTTAILLVGGSAWIVSMATLTVAGQTAFPNWVRARSSAIQLLTTQAAWALGALTWGKLAAAYQVIGAMRAAAGGLLLTLVLAAFVKLRRAASANVTPSNHWAPHSLAFAPAPTDGPVLIEVEYYIEAADRESFLAAIAKLREVRLRDGAFRWDVFQDLNDPNRFREIFHVGSWAEHLRQHARPTADDRRIEESIQTHHRGPDAPRVSHFLMCDKRHHVQSSDSA
jgi:quinol monooxygenase YgiN